MKYRFEHTKNSRSLETDKSLLSIKEILELIPGTNEYMINVKDFVSELKIILNLQQEFLTL